MLHKNYPTLMEAYSLLDSHLQRRYKLLIVGGGTSVDEQYLKGYSERLDLQDRIIFTGSVPHRQLASIYRGATLFAMPSYLETFGIPLIEAMASGLPVVAADTSAMPEILRDADILFDPCNAQELSECMASVLTDERIRDSLIEKGQARAKEFPLEATARQTLQVFIATSRPLSRRQIWKRT